MTSFRFRSEWPEWEDGKAPPGTDHGSDIEAMLHGGTLCRGNLYSVINWHSVTAAVVHARHLPIGDIDKSARLVWDIKPRIFADESYVRLAAG